MNKSLLWLFIGLGSIIGGLIPSWFGASYLSVWGILGSLIGAFAGVYAFRSIDL
jgi:predicted MFS family arabinose efflux permease